MPSGTEILFALGLSEQVLGVTDLCDYPSEARTKRIVSRSLVDPNDLTSAEVESRMREIIKRSMSPFLMDVEWFNTQKPDLILTQDLCYICDVDASEVVKVASPLAPSRILVLSPRTLAEIFENIKTVGEATSTGEQAEKLTKELRGRVNFVAERASKTSYKPRVISLEGINPLVAGGHWLPEMKTLAGGRDELFTPGCPAQRLSWETVVRAAPEVLVIALCSSHIPRSLKEVTWLASQEGWWELPAVESGQVYVIEHVYYSRPGPRAVKGLEILAQILHPEIFTGMIPPDTVVKLDPTITRGSKAEDIISCFRPYPEQPT